MQRAKKERIDVRHGYQAMDRMEEAGELIGQLIGDHADPTVECAYLDLVIESAEIGHELVENRDPQTVRNWLGPKRDILLAELQRRGIDQSEDAQCAVRKIAAVLSWVDSWTATSTLKGKGQ
jgi:hypothetical protein